MKKPRHHWFYDDLFLFNFRLVWPVTAESLEKYVKDEFKQTWRIRMDQRGFGAKYLFVPHAKSGTHVIALTGWKGTSDHHAQLSHECAHAARDICWQRDIRVTRRNDEAFCYLQAFILRRCLNVLLPKRLQVVPRGKL